MPLRQGNGMAEPARLRRTRGGCQLAQSPRRLHHGIGGNVDGETPVASCVDAKQVTLTGRNRVSRPPTGIPRDAIDLHLTSGHHQRPSLLVGPHLLKQCIVAPELDGSIVRCAREDQTAFCTCHSCRA
jgi:hypothetical protein